jgi:hypothetical protein
MLQRFRGWPTIVQVPVVIVLGLFAIGAAMAPFQKPTEQVATTKATTTTTEPTTTAIARPEGVPADVPVPDPVKTPGDVMTVDKDTLCVTGYTQTVRDVSAATKGKVFISYGVDPARSSEYEVDHLISLELGGSNDVTNLWPQPLNGQWGAKTKDRLENRLHFDICRGATTVEDAQHDIATNWYATFQRLLGPNAIAPTTTIAPTTLAPVTTRPPVTAAPKATAPPRTSPPATSPRATQPPPTQASYVTPGAYCGSEGATGTSKNGVPMTCSGQGCDGTPYDKPRWRRTNC